MTLITVETPVIQLQVVSFARTVEHTCVLMLSKDRLDPVLFEARDGRKRVGWHNLV